MSRAGKKRYPVDFQKRLVVQNAIGEGVETWQHQFNTFCEIKQSQTDALNDDDANLIISDVKLIVAKTSRTKEITATHYRAKINGELYQIDKTDPFDSIRDITLYASSYD
jgi:head-tail adaptor